MRIKCSWEGKKSPKLPKTDRTNQQTRVVHRAFQRFEMGAQEIRARGMGRAARGGRSPELMEGATMSGGAAARGVSDWSPGRDETDG